MIVLHSAVMVNSTIVFAVFALLLVPSLIVAEWERNIYVQSTGGIDNESCWTDETPCATINFALKGVKHDSTVIFVHPGTYGLDNGTETQLRGKSQVGIIGLSIPVNISCSPFTGLSFTMTENIILENLTFHGCGGLQNIDFNKQSFTFQVAVFMLFCKNIQINNVVIKSSNGIGLTMYNTVGNVSVWGSTLIDNKLKGQGSLNQFACGGGGMKIEFLALNINDMHTESTYITNTNYTISNSVFLSNKATSHYSCFLEHNSYGGGLSIILRGQASNNMFVIDSNVIESNNADNGGGLYISAESEISVFIRNTTISSNTAFTGLAVSLINNGSHSGDNYYEISNSTIIENSPKCKINKRSSSGTIFADGINLNFTGYILIERNYASGLKAKHQTKITVSEKSFLNFEENNGVVGGAIALFDCSYVVVYPNTQLNFTNNHVSDKGGAIYSGLCTFNGDNIIPVSQCFIQYYRPHIHPDEWEDVNFHFISNTYTACIPHYDEYDYYYYANFQYVKYNKSNAISTASLSLCWWPSLNSSLLTPDDTDNTLCWNNWYYSQYYCSVSENFDSDYNSHYYDNCSEDECSTANCRECVHYDKCKDNQAVPINSFQLSCYDCDSTSVVYGWLIFIFVQMLPVTLLVLLIMTLNINLTQGSASGYILYCQLLSTSFPGLRTGYPAWLQLPVSQTSPITFLPFSIWNLNFLTALPTCNSYPFTSEKISNGIPVFITCSMDQLGAISFWYLIAAYPMVLLILLYIWLMMYEKGFMCVVYITRPIHRLIARFWHMFDIEPSLIHSIASVYVLCFMQFAATSLKLLNVFYIDQYGKVQSNVTFYYDHSLHYFGWPHSLAGLFAVTILIFILIVPTLYVLFYPFKWFQRLLSKFKLNKQFLVALADVFTGPYKDGSDNSKGYRWFAGLYLLLRVVFISFYISGVDVLVVSLQLSLTLLMSIVLNIFRPYKRTIHNFSETSLWLLLSITSALRLSRYLTYLPFFGFIYFPLIIVIPYCVFWMVKKIKRCCDYHKSRRTAINNLDENTLTDENLKSPYMLSDDNDDVEFADRLMNPDLYDEQHVGILPVPSPPPPSSHESKLKTCPL